MPFCVLSKPDLCVKLLCAEVILNGLCSKSTVFASSSQLLSWHWCCFCLYIDLSCRALQSASTASNPIQSVVQKMIPDQAGSSHSGTQPQTQSQQMLDELGMHQPSMAAASGSSASYSNFPSQSSHVGGMPGQYSSADQMRQVKPASGPTSVTVNASGVPVSGQSAARRPPPGFSAPAKDGGGFAHMLHGDRSHQGDVYRYS